MDNITNTNGEKVFLTTRKKIIASVMIILFVMTEIAWIVIR